MVSILSHLPLSLLVTVYLVVELGDTEIVRVVSPVLQTLDVPPFIVRVAELPWQMVWLGDLVVVT